MSDQGERVAALRQGLNINPSALMGVPGAKPPPVRPYLTESAGGAPPASQPPAETAPPPPRPPKPRSSTLTEQDSAFDRPSSPPVLVHPNPPPPSRLTQAPVRPRHPPPPQPLGPRRSGLGSSPPQTRPHPVGGRAAAVPLRLHLKRPPPAQPGLSPAPPPHPPP